MRIHAVHLLGILITQAAIDQWHSYDFQTATFMQQHLSSLFAQFAPKYRLTYLFALLLPHQITLLMWHPPALPSDDLIALLRGDVLTFQSVHRFARSSLGLSLKRAALLPGHLKY